jgi:hypothetical protein
MLHITTLICAQVRINRKRKLLLALIGFGIRFGRTSKQTHGHRVPLCRIAIFAVVDEGNSITVFRVISKLVSRYFEFGGIPRGVPVGGSLCDTESDIVRGFLCPKI